MYIKQIKYDKNTEKNTMRMETKIRIPVHYNRIKVIITAEIRVLVHYNRISYNYRRTSS